MEQNLDDAVCYVQPRTTEQRVAIANDFVERFDFAIPLLVDGMDNQASAAYAAWPERLFVVEDGKIAYRGKPGPYRFDPEEVESWLRERYPETALAASQPDAPPVAGAIAVAAAPR